MTQRHDPPHDEPALPLLESYAGPWTGLRRFAARAMGTENVLLLESADERLAADVAQEAFAELARLEQVLSKFLPESDVSLVNLLGAERAVHVGPELLLLLELSRIASDATGGAFDPTVGPLLALWGLVDRVGRVPDAASLARALDAVGMRHVVVDTGRGTVRLARPGVAIDLGAIGKGYAADRVASIVRRRGVGCGAFTSGSSSIVAWGAPGGEPRWRVDVAHPDEPSGSVAAFEAEPGAVSASASYERSVRAGGEVVGHIVDPRTGGPAKRIKAVTVWTEGAVLGDVLSTAVFVLGEAALESGGALERLFDAWPRAGGDPESTARPRASVVVVRAAPSAWRGVGVDLRHFGAPGLTMVAKT